MFRGTQILSTTGSIFIASVLATTAVATSPNDANQSAKSKTSPDDRTIRLAIENELLSSDAVDGNNIDVSVQKGLVTLSGRVDNILAKEISALLATRILGVKAVSNQIVVLPLKRSDAKITKDIQNAFRNNPVTETKEIDVKVDDGKVTLLGKVESLAEKDIAQETASAIAGIVDIDNNITTTFAQKRPDNEIRKDVQMLLDSTVYLDDADIDVTVQDGTVVLNGIVSSNYAENFARNTAATVSGVKKVDARGLRMQRQGGSLRRKKHYADVSDTTIRDAIRLALRNDPRVLSFDPKVEVSDGVVSLSGNVGFLRAKQAAKNIALATIGVRRVRNHLKVRSTQHDPTDKQIAAYILQALQRDPYVQHQDIRVRVRQAHVTLYGLVDSKFEKMHAGWTASGQKGVVHMNNNLSVSRKWKPKSDQQIAETLREKLKFTFFDKAKNIKVTVEDGVAILRGTVDNWRAWQLAMDKAIEAGARRPHNLLQVRYGRAYSALGYRGPKMYIPR